MTQGNQPRPRIAIPQPTRDRADYNARTWPEYARAVEIAGGTPVNVPLDLTPAEIASLASTCQGILLPGSPADVNPAKYGAERDPRSANPDPARENADELLLQDAHNLRKPLLTICYGTQSLNTWRSGTLVQHLPLEPVRHPSQAGKAADHAIAIDPGSLLAAIISSSPEAIHTPEFLRLAVNSSHHQAIERAGDGLRVAARCPGDAVVEAVEGTQPGHFVLGLQWHPERDADVNHASRLIFTAFIQAAAHWQLRSV
jgi:putative glutamine amidotransferase